MIEETIVAIATPPGRGGVGIIRISGKKAYEIGTKITTKKKLVPRNAYYTAFKSIQLGEVLDYGFVIYFQKPLSFTGEDIIELQCHGSPFVLDCLVNECINYGARLARPGEFSERAFLNDKIDLTQAEAIADLIHASSLTAARMAIRSVEGELSRELQQISEQLIHLRMYVEAAIDFPEEEVDFLNDGKILQHLQQIIDSLQTLRKKTNQGAIMREGLTVVIAGKPNAGKSTLINYLSGREVAIVTPIAGTTRDIMKEQVLIDDIPIHLVDTAGLRESDDPVEKEGIRRAWQQVQQADCVLQLIDINNHDDSCLLNAEITRQLPANVPLLKIFNKIDCYDGKIPCDDGDSIYISAKAGTGLTELKTKLKSIVGYQPTEGQFLARRRHLHCLDRVLALLQQGLLALINIRAGELLAEDLKQAHHLLGEITGEFSADDLLGEIFSSFCIGK